MKKIGLLRRQRESDLSELSKQELEANNKVKYVIQFIPNINKKYYNVDEPHLYKIPIDEFNNIIYSISEIIKPNINKGE